MHLNIITELDIDWALQAASQGHEKTFEEIEDRWNEERPKVGSRCIDAALATQKILNSLSMDKRKSLDIDIQEED